MKYGKEITEEICQFLRDGMNQKDAAKLAGIAEKTYYQWKNEKSEFSKSIEKAEVEAKQSMIQTVRKAANKTWTAAAWWLERKHKDEFSLRTEMTGKDGEKLIDYSNLNKEEKKTLHVLLTKSESAAA